MASERTHPVILFCYPVSPWSLKVSTYLNLRNIPYFECHQPITWPRSDLQQLGINYRRIPILAIGKDIYCDTSLMLEKLEVIFPNRGLGHHGADGKAQESLLEQWSQSALMKTAGALLPSTLPLLHDPTFVADRKKLWGVDFSPEFMEKARPNAINDLGLHLKVIEGLLSDGRRWISGSDDISLADIHGKLMQSITQSESMFSVLADALRITVGFFFDWAAMIPGALPQDFTTSTEYHNARQYLQRYIATVAAAREQAGPDATLDGAEAIQLIKESGFTEPEGSVVDTHAGISKGQKVAVFRTDDISGHKDVGALLSLSAQESVIVVGQNAELRLHCPRMNFCITPVE